MCELSSIGLAVSAIGAAAGAVSAGQQASAQQQQYQYQAQVHRMNQEIAQREADDAIERGRIAEDAKRLQVGQLKARQTAAFAAAGVDVSSGTPADVLADTAQFGEMDALTIRANAEREALSKRTHAGYLGTKAQLADNAASSINPGMAVATSLIGSTGSVATKYSRFKFAKG